MPDVSFIRFQEKYPQYPDSLRSAYAESMVTGERIILQHGFYVDLEDRAEIDALLKVGVPEYIYCGTHELVAELSQAYPQLASLIKLHGWYEESIYMIMHSVELPLPA